MNKRSDPDAVLSSVRRLVTRDEEAPASAPKQGVVGRLLLTPSLRVEVEGDDPAPPRRRPPTALEQRIAELERAVGGQPGDWEPDEGDAQDAANLARPIVQSPDENAPRRPGKAPVAPAARDAHAPARTGEPAPGAPATEDDAAPAGSDALEALVAEAVRAEFAGEFGELVTRRVRRLVRREVNRILATKTIG